MLEHTRRWLHQHPKTAQWQLPMSFILVVLGIPVGMLGFFLHPILFWVGSGLMVASWSCYGLNLLDELND